MVPINRARRAGGIGVALAVLIALSGVPFAPANAAAPTDAPMETPSTAPSASPTESAPSKKAEPSDESSGLTDAPVSAGTPTSSPTDSAKSSEKSAEKKAAPTVDPAAKADSLAADALSCSAGTIYSISSGGQLRKLTSGTVTDVGSDADADGSDAFNGLGIGKSGQPVIAYNRTNDARTAEIFTFDGSTWSSTGKALNTSSNANGDFNGSLVAGGIDLSTGVYYFGGFSSNGKSFKLWSYTVSTKAFAYKGYIDTSSGAGGSNNGDLAFDADGNLFVVRGSGSTTTIFSVTAASLAAANGGLITSSKSADRTTTNNVNGVAFDSAGKGYLGADSTVLSYDMPAWSNKQDFISDDWPNDDGLRDSTDLASCSSPATITLTKNVVGRSAPGDQFTLELKQDTAVIGTATTTGSVTGVQTERVGPVPVTLGATIKFSETAAGTTNLANYGTTYKCTLDGKSMSPAVEGTTTSGTVKIPAAGSGQAIACEFTNTPNPATVTVDKKWNIDGTKYDNGKQPAGISAALSLSKVTNPQWGTSYDGFSIGDTISIGEKTTIDESKFPGCRLTSSTIAGGAITGSADLGTDFTTTLPTEKNAYTVTNTVTCQTLTIVKKVENSHGGTLAAADWNQRLHATPASGAKLTFDSAQKRFLKTGTYTISEDAVDGYTQKSIACTGGSFDAATAKVTVAEGKSVSCTITNTDEPGSVVWHKAADGGPDLGGSEWTLTGPGDSSATVTDCIAATAADCTGPDKDPAAGGFSVTGLDWGDYILVESKAPAGYVLDETEHPFSLTQTSLEHEFTTPFTNKQATAVTLPLTGGTGTLGFIVGGSALILLAGAGAIVISRRRARGRS